MSNVVFPVLKGLGWNVVKAPLWNTIKQRAASGSEVRVALMSYPLYNITLTYDFLRGDTGYIEIQKLIDFFNARQGSYDNFLLTDPSSPSDSAVTAEPFGTGDGTTTAFQLLRHQVAAGFAEPVMNLNGTPTIYDNGTPVTPASISSTGMVTFSAAPLAGHALTWTGAYYYRCRFDEDTYDFENFAYLLWQARTLKLVGSLGTKI